MEEVVEEVVRAAARVVTFTSTGARATRSARAARLVAGAVWRHSWSRQPRATLQPRAAHAGAREGGSQQSAEACAWCSRLPSLLLLRVGGVDSACTLPSIATAVNSRRGLGTEPPPPKAPGASGSWSSRGHFISAPGTGTRNASARGQRGMWPAPCGDDRTLVGQRPCCCRERRAGVRRGACGRGRGAATKHWSRAPALEGVWKCAGPCLPSGALWRRRDHDPGAPVRDARELALDEGGGRHPLVTVYSFNT